MCSSWSNMWIFHLKYLQMCPGYKLFENVNHFIRNMCKCVHSWSKIAIFNRNYVWIFYGSPMDPYKDPTWILCGGAANHPWMPIRIINGSYVGAQRAGRAGAADQTNWKSLQVQMKFNVFLQNINISFEICVNVFTADPKCKYFIWNMC